MKATDLPNLRGQVSNGLQLARQIQRAVGLVELQVTRTGVMPDSRDALVEFLQATITYLTDLDDRVAP